MGIFRKKTTGFVKLLRSWALGIRQDGSSLGYWNATRWHSIPLLNQLCHYLGIELYLKPFKVRLKGQPVWLRPMTSDYEIYKQVFLDEEYADVDRGRDVRSILDCGANIGLASIYFLNRFPNSRVLAVEPDPDNASICRRNLEPYGDRAVVLEGGVWSGNCRLTIVASEFGLGQKCGMAVRPFQDGDVLESTVPAFDIRSLMAYAGFDTVDLLKVDIERSELEVFSSSPDRWLVHVRNIVIELHGEDCSRVFFSALEGYNYRPSSRGDLTYCLDLQPSPKKAVVGGMDASAA